jgi:carbon storage regulator
MLILTRRAGETIVIETPSGEVVEVTVLGNNGPQVRMGVTAASHTSIDRQEIYERKKAERIL